ncbi:MAG: DUF2914 domain-containing protein [Candidatus Magasanikbacteria bacterium]|nr:DUF2914 domain-containing protein [Candidatus Magasanikbacteria bacterium]
MIKKRLAQSKTYKKIKHIYDAYEGFIIPSVLVLGFIIDVITFNTINLETALIILGVYLFVTAGTMYGITIYDHKYTTHTAIIARYARIVAAILMQFSIGALLSATLIFYSFGSAFSSSWPVIVFFIVLIIANERHKYLFQNLVVQIATLFLLMFVYGALILPVFFNTIATWVFMSAGLGALVATAGYYYALKAALPAVKEKKNKILFFVSLIYVLFNILYLTNVIPPVPLAIRESGIYHNITKEDQGYLVTREKQSIWQKIIPGTTIHIEKGKPVYAYMAIFAPQETSTQIIHEWQYFNPHTKKWEIRSKLPFTISGGRKEGFRGYSFKTQTAEGKWRIVTKLSNGQILGNTTFSLQYTDDAILLEKQLK